MTTGEGRAFAQMLAVFGELESAAISARITAARAHLLQSGRIAGGAPPYGWRGVPNPGGPGLVLAQDPEQIDWVRGMAARALDGASTKSIGRWLGESGAPFPRAAQSLRTKRTWQDGTVNRLLCNPLLAGMVRHSPGNGRHGRGLDVLRGADGQPVVYEHLAVISVEQHDQLLRRFADQASRYHEARELRVAVRPALAGLVTCATCEDLRIMRYGRSGGGAFLRCPSCRQVISAQTLLGHVERLLLADAGSHDVCYRGTTNSKEVDLGRLERVERSMRQTAMALTDDFADHAALNRQLLSLKETRTRLRQSIRHANLNEFRPAGFTVCDAWSRCIDEDQRRDVLTALIEKISVSRGLRGRYIDENRVSVTWKSLPVVITDPSLEVQAARPVMELNPWVSYAEAERLLKGSGVSLRGAVAAGRVERRPHRSRGAPSLSRSSIAALMYAPLTEQRLRD